MDEAYLKSRLVKACREVMPGSVAQRHEDKFTGGTPDLSLSWRGITSWVEVKYWRRGRPSRLTELQAVRLDDLRRTGVPAYCLTYADADAKRPKRTMLDDAAQWEGHAHQAVAELIRQDHLRRAWIAAQTDVGRVEAFHRKFDLGVADSPHFDDAIIARRMQHLREELDEIAAAWGDRNLVGIADGLADLVHVALGAALELGLPWGEIFAEVVRTNMLKERVRDATTGYKQGVRKPTGWTPPDVRGILERHGFKPTKEAA